MRQSKLNSLSEQFVQASVKFGTAMLCWYFIAGPLMGVYFTFSENFRVTLIFMVNSIVVGYFIRRGFDWWHHKPQEEVVLDAMKEGGYR